MFQSRLISSIRKSRAPTFLSHLKNSPNISNESIFPARFFASLAGRRNLFSGNVFTTKGFLLPPSKSMSTTAPLSLSGKSEITKAGLRLLVTEPHAQMKVGIWLFGCAAWVFSMVVLGGVTRLTRSGLSMTDWKFAGGLPPLSEEQWLFEFEKYQQSPEYKRVNKGMSIDDFKFIYWMEYVHRMWGRGLGIAFAVPVTYFLVKGYITRQLGLRLALFALGAGQGLIGWWMVKSGLEEPESEYVQPRVSPYRLAAHLTSAFVIYCGLLWTALSVIMPEPPNGPISWIQAAAKVRKLALPVSVLVGITAVSGAFVAGNDAGHAYNTFPKMWDKWIPDDIFDLEPAIRNFFENTSTLQVTLGISTLLSYVPVSLASAHQAGALTLLTLMVLLTHSVRKPSLPLLKSVRSLPKSKE